MNALPSGAAPGPLRRSPLDHVHDSLGARWRATDVRWPESYGDPAAEAVAVHDAVGLAELGPADTLVVRGRHTREALEAVDLPAEIGRVTRRGTREAWMLGTHEALVVIPDATSVGPPAAELSTRIGTAGATVTDLSSGLAALRLVGPSARSVLQELCPVDVSEVALADGAIVGAPMAGVRVLFARQDGPNAPGFTLLVARDEAEYLWGVLTRIGAPHGIRPVGGAAAR